MNGGNWLCDAGADSRGDTKQNMERVKQDLSGVYTRHPSVFALFAVVPRGLITHVVNRSRRTTKLCRNSCRHWGLSHKPVLYACLTTDDCCTLCYLDTFLCM